ncbi:MAG TPA: nucleoside 2-deoxyribosyltransferase, partial [Pyrinomonadaceae bacterium]
MADTKITTPKTFCFVLMPFSEEFDDVYRIGIKEACDKAGAYCERVDEQIFSERILDRVYNQIAKADIVIADMTGRNPNVFYEVGYAHALGKLTILLTRNADDIPFDLKHFTHIVYGTKISILRDELGKRVKFFIE